MHLTQYQQLAMRTKGKFNQFGSHLTARDQQLICGALGVAGEAGEFADLVKKIYFHNKEVDDDKLIKELGDVLWYMASVCDAKGWDLQDIAQKNIEKLAARYINGFSFEAANAPRKE